jgi:hypothetical protein
MKYLGTGEVDSHVCLRSPLTRYELMRPAGKVAEVVAGEATVTSKKGNEIKKKGTEEDPAVVIERSGVSRLSHHRYSARADE